MRQKEQSLLVMPDSLRKAQVQRWWPRSGVQAGRTQRPQEVPRVLPEAALLGERLLEEPPKEVLASEAAGEESWLGESFGRSPFVARVACPEVTLALRGPADPEELLQWELLEPCLPGEELLDEAHAAVVAAQVVDAKRPLWPQPPVVVEILGQDWLLEAPFEASAGALALALAASGDCRHSSACRARSSVQPGKARNARRHTRAARSRPPSLQSARTQRLQFCGSDGQRSLARQASSRTRCHSPSAV
mmetsp:Transcript_70753/g.143703  ORF Transcript_70753/g.143703 Transcript_70753/m.143703 type:complete len:248 (+) Transcript_70753:85-828(+)